MKPELYTFYFLNWSVITLNNYGLIAPYLANFLKLIIFCAQLTVLLDLSPVCLGMGGRFGSPCTTSLSNKKSQSDNGPSRFFQKKTENLTY